MNKEKFVNPEVEVIRFENEDIVTASSDCEWDGCTLIDIDCSHTDTCDDFGPLQ